MTPANEAAFLVAFAYIALILAVFWLGAVLAPHVARITRGWFGESADRLPEADELFRPPNLCGNRFDRLTCDRAWGHDGLHADSHTGRHDRPLTWRGDAA